MARPDLNLLFTLDVLLAEGSVARAARRLRLSPSAMSRALARLREATGDPLLVRAGRGLVASPRALELRDSVSQLVQGAEAALRPAGKPDLAQLERTFTLRASEGFVENFGAKLLSRIAEEAPKVRLHFLHKLDKDSGPLRDGSVDLETGVVDKAIGPEVRTQALFRDRYVGVVRVVHQGQADPRPLCCGQTRPCIATGQRQTTHRRRLGGHGTETTDRHDRGWLLGRARLGSRLRPGRLRSRAAHRSSIRRDAHLRAASAHRAVHGGLALASALGGRSSASLASGVRSGGLR